MSIRYGLIIDQERCIGCEACTVACKNENQGAQGWIRVETLNVEQKDTPQGQYPHLKMHFLKNVCQHCDNPPCAEACPLEALVKQENGLVLLDEATCDGCQTCLDACPYDALISNADTDKAEKCNLCSHRLEQGLEPFCVICCEGQAIYFGDVNDPKSRVSKRIAAGEAYQLLIEEGTGPGVYYIAPKEPRGL
ncbi:MAG: 4Fe-4S dicluster domain-containing protein [Deltaproteobacteria bacterium]|nr:4Fe-4S dicluster domain-containing protein [Deltaproteobacteria bacterium]